MQIKFQDGTTLDAICVKGGQIIAQGAHRDALEIQIAKGGITMDALDTLTADTTKTSKLTLIDGDQQYVHDNYNIRTELALRPVVVTPATGTDPAVTEDRLIVTLPQLTYQEQQAAQLSATQAAQADAIAELSILVSGGNA